MTGKLQNTSKSSEKIIKIEEFWKNKENLKNALFYCPTLKSTYTDCFLTSLKLLYAMNSKAYLTIQTLGLMK